MPKILAVAGSTREDSYNKRLVRVAAHAAEEAGAEVTVVDLRDYPLPLFDEDFETANGMPDAARDFKRLLVEHDGFLVASPEYNGSVTGVFKNAIDWASRAEDSDGGVPLVAYRGKVIALLSASPGALGGLRGLVHVRAIFSGLGAIVLPDQVAVSRAFEAFDTNGRLVDETMQKRVAGAAQGLVSVVAKLLG